jgi:acetyltransferase-like isoleucine patch superfamily enzyme
MHFGSNVYAHGHLWVHAINHYGGKQFKPQIEFGDRVAFSEGVHISCIEQISIGSYALIGSHVYISDHSHGSYRGPIQSHPDQPPIHRELGGGGPVDIGENVWIGDNVVIVGPVSIGRGSIIGANSVVRSDVPDYTMAAGVPAKALRRFDAPSGLWCNV